MCTKYKPQHQEEMIRARLRLLGRFLSEIQNIRPEITNFVSIYAPQNYDAVMYRAPSIASTTSTLLKQIGSIYISECIKSHENEEKKIVLPLKSDS